MFKKISSLSLVFFLSLLLTACIEITDPKEEAAKQEAIEKEEDEKKEKIAKEKKIAEDKKKKELAEKEEKEDAENAKYTYTDSDEQNLRESFEWLIEEQESLITSIEPLNDDNYDVIYAFVVDEVKMLDENRKQYLVDDWGSSIINLTNANLYNGFTDHPPMVHFKYQDGSPLADEKIMGGWKINN